MIKQFEKLTQDEQDLLLRAPVLVSVLAACSYNYVNKSQKADAIKLAHFKTFTAAPVLLPYYIEVDKTFREQFDATVEKYFPFDDEKREALKKEITHVNQVIAKLDKDYAAILHKSLEKYARHVNKAAHSVFEDFIFPIPIPGLTG
jgi:hypothetical protein